MKNKIKFVVFIIALVGFVILACLFFWQHKPSAQLTLKSNSFSELPGWQTADLRLSFEAFQRSCRVLLRKSPDKDVGSAFIPMQAKIWKPACQASFTVDSHSQENLKDFFMQWFTPVQFYQGKPVRGLFTGYYMPFLDGSLKKTNTYNVPVYGLPDNLITVNLGKFDKSLKHHRKLFGRVQNQQLVPYYTRAEIVNGAIKEHAKVHVWVKDPLDLQFLEIEGSGIVRLTNGDKMVLGYSGENGAPYKSIAKILIDQGEFTYANASRPRIRAYFKQYPDKIQDILNQNQSYVFFEAYDREQAFGAQGVALTPGYSLAIDRKFIPLGMPIWLDTTRPSSDDATKEEPLQRLMIAQDTGGAIRGPVRGDIYWGSGEKAEYIAGHMKHKGFYWLLLPTVKQGK